MPASFAEVTAVRPDGPDRFTAAAHPAWTIGGRPNGGYLLATAARAALSTAQRRDVLAASAHYLRVPDPGDVEIETTLLRAGRTVTQVRAVLGQRGTPCVEAVFLTGSLDPGSAPYWQGPATQPPAAGDGRRTRIPGTSPTGLQVPIFDEVEVTMDPADLGWASGRPSGRGELRAELGLPGGVDHDSVSLLYAADALPPATLDVEPTGWVPTLQLTVYVRASPAPGPVRVLQSAHLIEDQRVDEQCWVFDSRGRVVAQATQLAGIRLG